MKEKDFYQQLVVIQLLSQMNMSIARNISLFKNFNSFLSHLSPSPFPVATITLTLGSSFLLVIVKNGPFIGFFLSLSWLLFGLF